MSLHSLCLWLRRLNCLLVPLPPRVGSVVRTRRRPPASAPHFPTSRCEFAPEKETITGERKPYETIFIDMRLPEHKWPGDLLGLVKGQPGSGGSHHMSAYRQEVADPADEALNNRASTSFYKLLSMAEVFRLVNEIWERKQKEG